MRSSNCTICLWELTGILAGFWGREENGKRQGKGKGGRKVEGGKGEKRMRGKGNETKKRRGGEEGKGNGGGKERILCGCDFPQEKPCNNITDAAVTSK